MDPEMIERWAGAAAKVGGQAWEIAVAGSRAEAIGDMALAGAWIAFGVIFLAIGLVALWATTHYESSWEAEPMIMLAAVAILAAFAIFLFNGSGLRDGLVCYNAPEWCALKAMIAAVHP